MAGFIAKQLIGNQLDSVKGAVTGGDEKNEGGNERDPELEEALREAEERRQEKHRKIETERESMRQEIREKYNIRKKEDEFANIMAANEDPGRLGRTRKTQAELKAEAQAAEDEEDSIINMLPENMRGYAKQVADAPTKLVSEAQEKCSLM